MIANDTCAITALDNAKIRGHHTTFMFANHLCPRSLHADGRVFAVAEPSRFAPPTAAGTTPNRADDPCGGGGEGGGAVLPRIEREPDRDIMPPALLGQQVEIESIIGQQPPVPPPCHVMRKSRHQHPRNAIHGFIL